MTEQELRALVREAIHLRASRFGGQDAGHDEVSVGAPAGGGRYATTEVQQHAASHALFVLPAGADADGPCIIEPAVSCNHCGYCKSYGH